MSRECSVGGCCRPHEALGYCAMHYNRVRRNGDPGDHGSREFHGMRGTTEYTVWSNMKARCENPANTEFRNYGARGIAVCEEWRRSFARFYSDMGDRPSRGHTLDRIDNDGDYTPTNCRWATHVTQGNNRSNNRRIRIGGMDRTLAEWCREYGVSPKLVGARINQYSWSPLAALIAPKNCRRSRAERLAIVEAHK